MSQFSAALAAVLAVAPAVAAKGRALELRHHRMELPGAPAALIDTDLDGDGIRDLAVVVAYTDIENVGGDRIEDMVQISTVIPALFDRREIRAWLGRPDGTLEALDAPFALDETVLALSAGSAAAPLLALTDAGVAALRFDDGSGRLTLELLAEEPPVIRGAGRFFSTLEWVHDLDGDGAPDVLFPAIVGPAVYLSREGEIASAAWRHALPVDDRDDDGSSLPRRYPYPEVHDVDGDGVVDLVFKSRRHALHVLIGRGDGTFRPVRDATCLAAAAEVRGAWLGELAHFGDIDGDGRAELVSIEEIEPDKDGMRAELRQAKQPRNRYRFYRTSAELTLATEPYLDFVAVGHSFQEIDLSAAEINLFQDLDGDGRKDLVTVTLEFSLLQAIRILATKKISIGLDFHVWVQEPDGTFREVAGNDLSEKLRFDLDDLKLGRLAQFKGDFDGDGRVDFVHFGRGKAVTIHRGQPGGRYPQRPDLVVELEEEPQDLGLVRVDDYDGDGRSDLAFIRVLPVERADVSPPVLLDLYLSGGAREGER